MKKIILLLLFIPLVSFGQDTIPATKILTQKEAYKKKMMKLKKEYKVNHKDKIKPGNTSFNSNDRIAIKMLLMPMVFIGILTILMGIYLFS